MQGSHKIEKSQENQENQEMSGKIISFSDYLNSQEK
jgi:hypothetical protein